MFENFTEEAIRTIMLAQIEAEHLGHNFVGTEAILLGLLHKSLEHLQKRWSSADWTWMMLELEYARLSDKAPIGSFRLTYLYPRKKLIVIGEWYLRDGT